MKLITHYPGAQQGDPHAGRNWRENYLTDSLYYSCRETVYTRQTYPSSLHYHDYCELVVFLSGEIRYICEGEAYSPRPGDVLLIPPGKLHMSAPESDSVRYVRHVFYFYPDAFDALGMRVLTDFAAQAQGLCVSHADVTELLSQMDAALEAGDEASRALALGLAIQIFHRFGRAAFGPGGALPLPDNVLRIQSWLDENFAMVAGVAETAQHFYYSREYVSRLWRKHFNTTVADYIQKRRVAHAQGLIAQGAELSDACYQCGFGSMSTFIRAFRSVTGMTPSEYRRMRR